MHAVIVGAGVGGMALAYLLDRSGVEISVIERDLGAGYRLHLGEDATAVLRSALPAARFRALVASSAGGWTFSQFGVLDHRGRALLRLPRDPRDGSLLIGRRPLVRLLAGPIEWGAPASGTSSWYRPGSCDDLLANPAGRVFCAATPARRRSSACHRGRRPPARAPRSCPTTLPRVQRHSSPEPSSGYP